MRQRHAFGPARGPRRVEDDGEVGVLALRGRNVVRLARDLRPYQLVGRPPPTSTGRRGPPPLDLPRASRRGDDDLRLGVGQDMAHFPGASRNTTGTMTAPTLKMPP